MLPARARLRNSRDFQATFRGGVRVGRSTLVVHAHVNEPHSSSRAPRVGFVVSKKVGGAVVRNRVKRQLRHLVAAELRGSASPQDESAPGLGGMHIVVRALPPAAQDARQLRDDLRSAWPVAVRRARARVADDGPLA